MKFIIKCPAARLTVDNGHDLFKGEIKPDSKALEAVNLIVQATKGRCGKCEAILEVKKQPS